MSRRRLAIVVVAVVVAVVGLVRCGADVVGLSRTGTANSDQAFRNGSFLIRATSVAYGVREIDVDAAAKARAVSAHKPGNGQFIVFYAEATNVGLTSASMPSTASTLSDAAGKAYPAAGPFVGQGFDQRQLPGTRRSGWFAFDVPESVTDITTLNVQSDPSPDTTNPPTRVRFG